MKRIIALCALFAGLTACAKSGGGSSSAASFQYTCPNLAGTYLDTYGGQLVLGSNCQFMGSACSATGTVTFTDSNTGAAQINVATSVVASQCLAVGAHNCTLGLNGSLLTLSCDSGTAQQVYQRE